MAEITILANVNTKSLKRKGRSIILTMRLTLYLAWSWRFGRSLKNKTLSLTLLCRKGMQLFKASGS